MFNGAAGKHTNARTPAMCDSFLQAQIKALTLIGAKSRASRDGGDMRYFTIFYDPEMPMLPNVLHKLNRTDFVGVRQSWTEPKSRQKLMAAIMR